MKMVVTIPSSSQSREHSVDFGGLMGRGIDVLVRAVVRTLKEEIKQEVRSVATIDAVIYEVKNTFLPWVTGAASLLDRPFELSDIDQPFLTQYAAYLRNGNSYSFAGIKYSHAMTLIEAMCRLNYLAPYAEIAPRNQFPGAAAAKRSSPPYSTRERDELLRALAADFRAIREGMHPDLVAGSTDSLVIGLLLLAIPTGFNLTPLLEIRRDALRPHPLHKNEWLLVAYKRRAHKEVSASAKWSDKIEEMHSLDLHIVTIFRELLRWTDEASVAANETDNNLLFLRPPLRGREVKKGRPVPLTASDVNSVIAKINARYDIKSDDGQRLGISTRRLRTTLAARIYELSGGDPFVVAKVLGNLPRTTAVSYLEPELGAPEKFAEAVDRFAKRLIEAANERSVATPVGGCSDPLRGRFAPKDGFTYCQRWLHCFQCPNQCITGDDQALWRLYSFFWLLQAKLQRIRRLRIYGQVRFALHVIDTVVKEKFGKAAERAKERARTDPHPVWASVKAIDALFKEVPDVGGH